MYHELRWLVSVQYFCLKTHRWDRVCLQRHLAASHDTCRLLRTRMEELVRFLEDLLSVTPPQGQGSRTRELMVSRLNETLELLAEVASKHIDYGKSILWQGWANYGPRAACGPPEYIMRPVMRIKTSELVPQFKNIVQNGEQLHSSQ